MKQNMAEMPTDEYWLDINDLHQKVESLTIPDEWLTTENKFPSDKEVACTKEYLLQVATRLASSTPLTHDQWRDIIKSFNNKINRSNQPAAQYLWILALEKGIRDLAKIIQDANAEAIRAEAKTTGQNTQDIFDKWYTWNAFYSNAAIDHLIDPTAGTSNENIERLGNIKIETVNIPLYRLAYAVGASDEWVKQHWQQQSELSGQMILRGAGEDQTIRQKRQEELEHYVLSRAKGETTEKRYFKQQA